MTAERLAMHLEDAWFWVMVGADFLLVASSFFTLLYLAGTALSALLPRRPEAERLLPGVFALFALALALSCTHLSRVVAGLWKGGVAALLGADAEVWFPHVPILVWLVGTAALLVALAVRYFTIATTLRRLPGLADPVFAEACAAAGWTRPVALNNCGSLSSACSWGIVRPRVLVPANFMVTFSEIERRCIYTHELVHLGKRDSLKCLFVAALRALFWFHPVVCHALRSLISRIEVECDRDTVRVCGVDPVRYAGLILKAHASKQDLVPGFSFEKGAVRKRIGHIVGEPSLIFPPARTVRRAALFLACLLAASAFLQDFIAAEWHLPDPDPLALAKGANAPSPAIGFFWNGALGTYIKISFPDE